MKILYPQTFGFLHDQNLILQGYELSSSTVNNYLKAEATITKAIRLRKKSNKPRLLKVTVDTVEVKAFILRNCTNLRKADPSSFYHKIYIIPDLTPAEREANRQLRLKLKEMNKDGRNYRKKKNGKIVQRRNWLPPLALIII